MHPDCGGKYFGGIASLMHDFCNQLNKEDIETAIINRHPHTQHNGYYTEKHKGNTLCFFPTAKKSLTDRGFLSIWKKIIILSNGILQLLTNHKLDYLFYKSHEYFFTQYFISQFKPDIVHLHYRTRHPAFTYLKAIKNIPVVLTVHGLHTHEGDIENLITYKLNKFISQRKPVYQIVNHVIFLSENNYLKSEKYIGHVDNYSIIPNGINTDSYKMFSKSQILNQFKLNNDDYFVLFTGSVDKRKGINTIVNVAQRINSSKIKFIIVGDGPLLEWAKDFVKKHDLNDKFIFTGQIKSKDLVSKYYSLADLFLFPTKAEAAASISILEAMLYKIPILTTRPSLGSFFGINENNVFLIDILQPKEIASTIENCFKDREAGFNKAIESHTFLKNKLTWDKVVNKYYIPLYRNILTSHQKAQKVDLGSR